MKPSVKYTAEKMNYLGKKRLPFLFLIDYEMNEPRVIPLDEINPAEILYALPNQKNLSSGVVSSTEIKLEKYPVDYAQYKKAYDVVRKAVEEGNTYLTNLTFPTPIKINLSLEEIFHISRAKFKLLLNDKFVVFSPEEFVRIENGIIASFPMKGTIDASIPDAESIILNDEKETAEHTTIVDLIRNDLSMVAADVHVKRFRFIDEIITSGKRLLQVSSEICGILPSNYEEYLGDIICKLLPAGSISGAPKKKTMEIINNAEISPRGFYTGVFGVYDGTTLTSAVMIRFIEKNGNEFIYRSGGGITYMSNPESEYQELVDKVYVPVG